jgi:hypothetical protein
MIPQTIPALKIPSTTPQPEKVIAVMNRDDRIRVCFFICFFKANSQTSFPGKYMPDNLVLKGFTGIYTSLHLRNSFLINRKKRIPFIRKGFLRGFD